MADANQNRVNTEQKHRRADLALEMSFVLIGMFTAFMGIGNLARGPLRTGITSVWKFAKVAMYSLMTGLGIKLTIMGVQINAVRHAKEEMEKTQPTLAPAITIPVTSIPRTQQQSDAAYFQEREARRKKEIEKTGLVLS